MQQSLPSYLVSNGKILDLSTPIVMGIINATPDSFYTKNLSNTEDTIYRRIESMIQDGAQIIDIGGMSTRPNSEAVSIDEEIHRILPFVEWTREHFPSVFISIDTYRSEVIKACLPYKIDILNDISGANFDEDLLTICAEQKLIYIASHIQGTPSDMQNNPQYQDIINEVSDYFHSFISLLRKKNIHQYILDPGFGFGKNISHNYQLLEIYKLLKHLHIPMMAGISRKSMIWKVLNSSPDESLAGTITAQTIALLNGASILRVHDVKEAMDSIQIVKEYRKHDSYF